MRFGREDTRELIDKACELGASLAGVTPLRLEQTSGSLMVLALSHPESDPELDHWGGSRGSEGNRILHEIKVRLVGWLREKRGVSARVLPYQVKDGGVYLKDAAVLAGLGVFGKNNLLITPQLGPRVRLSALWMEADAPEPEKSLFDPCEMCPTPCWDVCPRQAFKNKSFDRSACMQQMQADKETARIRGADRVSLIAYCRDCELTCPAVGGE